MDHAGARSARLGGRAFKAAASAVVGDLGRERMAPLVLGATWVITVLVCLGLWALVIWGLWALFT
jgi:hypothetical protein